MNIKLDFIITALMLSRYKPYFVLRNHFFFSQVRPSPDNLATNCLSQDVRNRNIRRVETNARVAFVVWILEICANICIIIVWAVVYGKTTFLSACENGYLKIVEIFIQKSEEFNIDLKAKDIHGKTPLECSVRHFIHASIRTCIPLNKE